MRRIAAAAASLVVLAGGVGDSARYVQGRQAASGGFAEPGGQATPGLTAWAVLGLRAAGHPAHQ
ncbi:MAG: hypothetical protein ACRDM9_09885, partial [Gaiellaceae bacterium]